jgi:hypothetical protein
LRINWKLLIESRVENQEVVYSASWFPERNIHGWVIEEEKLHFFVDFMEDDIGLQKNETGLLRNSEVDVFIEMVFT